jgi:hypothetical protein
VRLAGSEDELDATLAREVLRGSTHLREERATPQVLCHHAPLAHAHRLDGHLAEEGGERVVANLPLREGRVTPPAEPRRPHDLTVLGGVEDAARLVLRLDEETVLVIRDACVAAHLFDVDVITEAIDGALLILRLGAVNPRPDQRKPPRLDGSPRE